MALKEDHLYFRWAEGGTDRDFLMDYWQNRVGCFKATVRDIVGSGYEEQQSECQGSCLSYTQQNKASPTDAI